MIRGALTKYAPLMRDPDPLGPERIAKRMWHEEGAIVITKRQFDQMGSVERMMVEAIAIRQYGKRGAQ